MGKGASLCSLGRGDTPVLATEEGSWAAAPVVASEVSSGQVCFCIHAPGQLCLVHTLRTTEFQVQVVSCFMEKGTTAPI